MGRPKDKPMSYEERVTSFQGVPVTLNGELAKVVGFRMKWAIVATVRPGGPAHEWSWRTVERVIKNKAGQFFS